MVSGHGGGREVRGDDIAHKLCDAPQPRRLTGIFVPDQPDRTCRNLRDQPNEPQSRMKHRQIRGQDGKTRPGFCRDSQRRRR